MNYFQRVIEKKKRLKKLKRLCKKCKVNWFIPTSKHSIICFECKTKLYEQRRLKLIEIWKQKRKKE